MTHLRLAAVGLCAALLTAGTACGSGGGLSAKEFIEKANTICTRGDDDLVEEGKKLVAAAGGKQPSVDAVVGFFKDQALPIAKRKLDDLEKLDVGGDREDGLKELVKAGREAITEVETGLSEDGAKFLASQGPDPFAAFNEQARELDLDKCAGESATPAPSTETTATTPAVAPPAETAPTETTATTAAPG